MKSSDIPDPKARAAARRLEEHFPDRWGDPEARRLRKLARRLKRQVLRLRRLALDKPPPDENEPPAKSRTPIP